MFVEGGLKVFVDKRSSVGHSRRLSLPSVCIKVFPEDCLLLYPQIPSIDQLEIHFAMDSNLLHKESDEAAQQLAKQEGQGEDGRDEGVRVWRRWD